MSAQILIGGLLAVLPGGKEYDICSECWNPFEQRLRGKGRKKDRDTVFLPAPRTLTQRENEEISYRENLQKSGAQLTGHIDTPGFYRCPG
jgi:hypothetical protein